MILFAIWVIVGEQITGVSSDAVVNARLSTVRAPVAGTMDMPRRPFGSVILEDEELANLGDPLVDTVRLNDLRMECAFTAAEVARLVAFGAQRAGPNASAETISADVLANCSPRTTMRSGASGLVAYLSKARRPLAAIDARLMEETA